MSRVQYIMFNDSGEILRTGSCSPASFAFKQTKPDVFCMEGKADDVTQKITFSGLDAEGKPVNPQVVNKPPDELPKPPPPVPENKKPAEITKGQWQALLDRVENLEQP